MSPNAESVLRVHANNQFRSLYAKPETGLGAQETDDAYQELVNLGYVEKVGPKATSGGAAHPLVRITQRGKDVMWKR